MSTPSEYSVFKALFRAACKEYEIRMGTNLIEHPLAIQLQTCNSFESLISLLQGQARAFRGFQRIEGKAVLDGAGSFGGLVNLFESITAFLHRLDIYIKIPPTAAMTEIVVNMMVELLFTLALAAKQMKQGPQEKTGLNLPGDNEIDRVLQRLDRVTQNEARTTAAQTLQVVYGLVQNVKLIMDDCKAATDGVRETLLTTQQIVIDKNNSNREQFQQDVQSWLSPPDPWEIQGKASKAHHNGTATWFIQGDTFAEWKASGSLLWVHGKPGSGKTIFSSVIIEDINRMHKAGLASFAFFYFDFRDEKKKDLRSLLSSLLFQLYYQSDSYSKIFSDFYSAHRCGSQYPSDAALTQCLKDMLNCPEQAPVYIIMDGVDECPKSSGTLYPREEVLMLVEELVGSGVSNLRICITTRPEIDIKTIIHPLTSHSVSLHDERGQIQDIVDYVRSIVNLDAGMRRWRLEDKELVINSLSEKADGMFRLVASQFHVLRSCHPLRILRALDEFPATLDWTYERALQDIPDTMWESAHLLLQCVLVSSRPLLVEELAEFLAFDFDTGTLPKFQASCRPEDPEDAVLSMCPGLLAIVGTNASRTVQFCHSSVKKFLISSRLAKAGNRSSRYLANMTRAHNTVAKACLSVLLSLDGEVSKDNLRNFPLAAYAAKHWVDHAQFNSISQHIQDGVKLLLDPSRPHFSIWTSMYKSDGCLPPHPQPKSSSQLGRTLLHHAATYNLPDVTDFLASVPWQDINAVSNSHKETPLMVASEMGHVEIVRVLLARGANANAQDNNKWTPLHWASQEGHLEAAQLLLEHGVDANAYDQSNQTPLHLASEEGYLDVARLLLERGAHANTLDKGGQTPLHIASRKGHLETAQLLLEHGVDANACDQSKQTPLHLASEEGYLDVAQLLLERGAHANTLDKGGQTPLYIASREGHLENVQLLLEHGADANARDRSGRTPLHMALQKGRVEIAQLLERGADANILDDIVQTVLHTASREGRLEITQLLFKCGADANTQDDSGQTLLHMASREGRLEVAQLLLEKRADPNARDRTKRTPLHMASQEGRLEAAQLLLEHGVDANARDQSKQTPLHLASEEGYLDVARLLLERGADGNTLDNSDQTPLHIASREGRLENAQLLLKHGADANARDRSGRTPLYMALQKGRVEIAQLLLERGADGNVIDKTLLHMASREGRLETAQLLFKCGADANTRDDSGQTPLHMASREGRLEVAQLLLEKRADPNARDWTKRIPLHMASQEGRLEVARLLLERGADVNSRDQNGWTPLHWVSQSGRLEVAQLLLDRGASVNATDRWGHTASHLASQRSHVEVAQYLCERGGVST